MKGMSAVVAIVLSLAVILILLFSAFGPGSITKSLNKWFFAENSDFGKELNKEQIFLYPDEKTPQSAVGESLPLKKIIGNKEQVAHELALEVVTCWRESDQAFNREQVSKEFFCKEVCVCKEQCICKNYGEAITPGEFTCFVTATDIYTKLLKLAGSDSSILKIANEFKIAIPQGRYTGNIQDKYATGTDKTRAQNACLVEKEMYKLYAYVQRPAPFNGVYVEHS